MPCGWEGNRRSGVALAMRHRLQWRIHLRAHGLRKGDEHPAYTRRGVWHTLPYIYLHNILLATTAVETDNNHSSESRHDNVFTPISMLL